MPDYSHISRAASAGMQEPGMPNGAIAYLQGIRDITKWLTDPTYTARHLDEFLHVVAVLYSREREDPDV
jgi:hypothetical protein